MGVVFKVHSLVLLAFLPSFGLALDTCGLVCRDKDFLHDSCYGEVCVLLQPGYDRGSMPDPQGMDGVLHVEAYIKVLSVAEVDLQNGMVAVDFDLQLAWRDPGLSVCGCMGNSVRTEYQMDATLKEKIWTPRLSFLKSIFLNDKNRRGLLVEDHKDAVGIFQNYQIRTTVDCDFSKQLITYPFGTTKCLFQMEEKVEPLSVLKFNTTLTTMHNTLNELNSAFKITERGLSYKEQKNVPDFSFSGKREYHSCTGFVLVLTKENDSTLAYALSYFVLASMAALSVNLKSDKLSPLANSIVAAQAIYLDAIKIYPQPIHGLSFLNIFCIVSNLVLLLTFIGLIISSKKRYCPFFHESILHKIQVAEAVCT